MDMKQSTTWYVFEGLRSIPGSMFLFPGSVFVNIMEKRVNRFSWNFHGIQSSRRGASVSNITVKSMSAFSEYIVYDTRTNLEHAGDDRFEALDTGFFTLFYGSVFVGNKG